MTDNADERWIGSLVAALKRLTGGGDRERDSAALAKLRRGLGRPVGQGGERDVWLYRHLGGAKPEHEEPAALVASLFALHPAAGGSGNLGAAFRRLYALMNESPSVEKRFAALLDAEAEDLHGRLRQAVSLLKAKEVAIDWKQLLYDLLRWDAEKRPVQRRWARDFWAAREAPAPTAGTDTKTPTEGGNES